MDDEFLEPATRAVLSMAATLLLHQSEEFSRKLCKKFRETKLALKSSQPIDSILDSPGRAVHDESLELSSELSESAASLDEVEPPSISIRYEDHPAHRTIPEPSRTPLSYGLHGSIHAARSPHSDYVEYLKPSQVVPGSSYDAGIRSYRSHSPAAPPSLRMPTTPQLSDFEPSHRTPTTPQRSDVGPAMAAPMSLRRRALLQRQAALLTSTPETSGPLPRTMYPAEPSPILSTPGRSPAARRLDVSARSIPQQSPAGSIAYRTPQGYRVMTPDSARSRRIARREATPYPRYVSGYQPTLPSDQSDSFAFSTPRSQRLQESSIPSLGGTPVIRPKRWLWGHGDISFDTPESRKSRVLDLSEPPPTPVDITPESLSPRPRRRFVQSRSPYHRKHAMPSPGLSPILADSYVGSQRGRRSPASPYSVRQRGRFEERLDEVEADFAPDLSTSSRGGERSHDLTPAAANAAASAAVYDIQEALRVLQGKINRQMDILKTGTRPMGIIRRDSADFDFELGRMRD